MNNKPKGAAGFTLTEMAIATAIMMLALSLAMTGYLYVWSESNKSMTQDELDVQVQMSIESIKRDLRLTALEKMFYYPAGAGPYTAVSMPRAQDDNGDGAVDTDSSGKIIWDKTVIYHVWSGNPTQLRRTTIDPRDNSLSATQFQAQVNSVATVGNGSATYGSTNASTEVIFQNLFTWNVQPQSSTFDGYSATQMRDLGVVLGSAVISNGTHTLQFRVTGKHPSSSGYRLGLDTLFMSPSAAEREAEEQLPATAAVGAVPTNAYMTAGSWSGNYQLSFPATATGQSFTVMMNSDRWVESNFGGLGEVHDDTTVLWDTTLSPSNFAVQLEGGFLPNWYSSTQTGDANGSQYVADNLLGCAVRVLIRGKNLEDGNAILASAGRCWVYFRSGSMGSLTITDAYIAEAAVTGGEVSLNAVPGTATRLKFGSANGVTLAANTATYTDQAVFAMDKKRSYLVSYLVSGTAGNGNAWRWVQTNNTAYAGAYVILATNAPTAATLAVDTWSTRTDVFLTNAIPVIGLTYGTYPSNGVYTSAIFDTHKDAPVYSTLGWNVTMPSGGGYLGLKVRAANSNDMSDANSWTNLTALTSPGAITPYSRRYVQFQATLRPPAGFLYTPRLRDVTTSWAAETKMVDIGGTFTKGTNYGIFEMLVDGQPLKKGVVVNLEIFDYSRAHGTSNRITSAATTEVTPRNSGR